MITRFGLRSFEKCFEHTFPHVCSTVQNLCLGSIKFMLPKQRFWTVEQSVACAFLKYFSRVWVLLLGYHWLKTRSKIIRNALFDSKILRLGSIILQPSATSPLFFDNLHFEHFDKSVNHEFRLTLLSKCSKRRLSKNRWLVADGCNISILKDENVIACPNVSTHVWWWCSLSRGHEKLRIYAPQTKN